MSLSKFKRVGQFFQWMKSSTFLENPSNLFGIPQYANIFQCFGACPLTTCECSRKIRANPCSCQNFNELDNFSHEWKIPLISFQSFVLFDRSFIALKLTKLLKMKFEHMLSIRTNINVVIILGQILLTIALILHGCISILWYNTIMSITKFIDRKVWFKRVGGHSGSVTLIRPSSNYSMKILSVLLPHFWLADNFSVFCFSDSFEVCLSSINFVGSWSRYRLLIRPSKHGPDFHRPQSQITIDSPDFHLWRSQICLLGYVHLWCWYCLIDYHDHFCFDKYMDYWWC